MLFDNIVIMGVTIHQYIDISRYEVKRYTYRIANLSIDTKRYVYCTFAYSEVYQFKQVFLAPGNSLIHQTV